MNELYEKVKEILTQRHVQEMEELKNKFGINGHSENENHSPTPKVNGKLKKGVVQDAILKNAGEFGRSFTTTEMIESLRQKNRPIWFRIKKTGSVSPGLHRLWILGKIDKRIEDGICHWTSKFN